MFAVFSPTFFPRRFLAFSLFFLILSLLCLSSLPFLHFGLYSPCPVLYFSSHSWLTLSYLLIPFVFSIVLSYDFLFLSFILIFFIFLSFLLSCSRSSFLPDFLPCFPFLLVTSSSLLLVSTFLSCISTRFSYCSCFVLSCVLISSILLSCLVQPLSPLCLPLVFFSLVYLLFSFLFALLSCFTFLALFSLNLPLSYHFYYLSSPITCCLFLLLIFPLPVSSLLLFHLSCSSTIFSVSSSFILSR